MKRFVVVSALASLAACVPASAQDYTQIDIALNYDNARWACNEVPGYRGIYAKIVVSKVGPTPVYGLSSITFQPEVNGLSSEGRLLPFTFSPAGEAVPDTNGLPAQLGRLIPFGASPQNAISASGPIEVHGLGTGTLRIAGHNATTATTNLAWGVNCGQLPRYLAGTSYNSASSVAVFKFGIAADNSVGLESLASVPIENVQRVQGVPGAYWYTNPEGTERAWFPLTAETNHVAQIFNGLGGSGCRCSPFVGPLVQQRRPIGGAVRFDALPVQACVPYFVQAMPRWYKDGVPLAAGGATTISPDGRFLTISPLASEDAGIYHATIPTGMTYETNHVGLVLYCAADVDDGTATGTPDGGVTIDDLLYYLDLYAAGNPRADIDDGTGTGTPDGGVGIEDLLFYLARYNAGC